MKQNLVIGNTVDDGTGDYLNKGGKKIINNFDDLYYELGDGSNPHAAGAWKTTSDADINGQFGKAYALNTTSNRITFRLPKGTTNDYNKVIRLRDVFAKWRTNPVTVIPASGDTIKGNAVSVVLSSNYADIEMVYCAPGRWEYVANKQIDKSTSADLSAVIKREFLATAGQVDFLDIFDGQEYNKANLEIYHRGNLLYYGNTFSTDSDYGSPGSGSSVVALNGKDVRLKRPCVEGDSVVIISYVDGLTQWRSTYNRLELRVLDESSTNEVSVEGGVYVGDLSTVKTLPIEAFGYEIGAGLINPNSLEVYINGVILTEAGSGGLPAFICEGAEANNLSDCLASGGLWLDSDIDYSYTQDSSGNVDNITFGRGFSHGDVVTIKWYNNNIGTTLSIEEILDQTNDLYIGSGQPINVTGGVRVTDFQNPTWPNVELLEPYNVSISTASNMFDLIYPVGSVYENFINPNNPSTYMGFGSWVLAGTKQVLVGWTPDDSSVFGLNNNDLDTLGNPSKRAGGTGGVMENTLSNEQLPATKTDEKVLIDDENGGVIIGGCQFDPDDQGPAYQKYREDFATTNKTHAPPQSINNLQPYVTVYRWMRIA